MSGGAWLSIKPRAVASKVRMFCFPYAGGGVRTFRGWEKLFPDNVEVLPVQLPGRERRFSEVPFDNVLDMAPQLVAGLLPFLRPPFAFFGHSMGALIAYELAVRLLPHGLEPAMLLVSGAGAPTLSRHHNPVHALPGPEFRASLSDIGGTPPEVLNNQELLGIVEPLLRADFKMAETYRPRYAPSLSCPIRAYGGAQDDDVPEAEVCAWQEVTTGIFSSRFFPGGHFYLYTEREALLTDIAEVLGDVGAISWGW